MNAPTRAVWLAAAIAASACRSGPDYAPPELALPSGFAFADDAVFPPVAAAADWWTALQSRELDALVAAVDRDGLDLQVAGHRIAQARAAAGLAAAAAWPSVGAAAEFTRQRTTAATPSPVRGRAFDTVAETRSPRSHLCIRSTKVGTTHKPLVRTLMARCFGLNLYRARAVGPCSDRSEPQLTGVRNSRPPR